jgi:hypothetical protein
MGSFEPSATAPVVHGLTPLTLSRFWRAEPVGKTDSVSVGRAREIGWRQSGHGGAAPRGRPEYRQDRRWRFSA